MKCVVTGATGFIGSELCRQLEARNIEVMSCGREPASAQAMATAHSLFCCAGVAHQSASPEQHEEANYRSVLQQAHAAHEAGVRQFVFLSSVKADAKGNSYGYWKWRAEQELQQSFAQAAMNVVIVRPALVYGPGVKGNLRNLMKAAALGLPIPPPSQPRSLIGIGDLCRALCSLLDKDLSGVQVVIATDGESYDLRRIRAAVRSAQGKGPGINWAPAWLWRLGMTALDQLQRDASSASSYDKMFAGELYSNQQLCELLDWQPQQTLENLAPEMLQELH